MSLVPDNSSPMGNNIIRSGSSPPPNDFIIDVEMLEQFYEGQEFGPPSFDSIPQLSGQHIVVDGNIFRSASCSPPPPPPPPKLDGNTTQKGEMKAESYEDPLLPLKNNSARELEDLSSIAFLRLVMCYGVMYILYSAFLGNKGSNMWVMTGLLIWNAVLQLLMILLAFMSLLVFIGSFIRFSFGAFKVMRLVISGLLLVSLSIMFILLLLQLGLFPFLNDKT